jgi:hypothetical protein
VVDDVQTGDSYAVVSQEEWDQASRACRTATWSAVFYLVTTNIMGPYSVPYVLQEYHIDAVLTLLRWAMAQLGYGPGISLYVIFGILAGW